MDDTTISINGGPEVNMDVMREALNQIKGSEYPNLKEFFAEVDVKEEEISGIRTEINECFDSYCSSTGTNKDALKLAYKLYKAINKDKNKAEVMQFEYDKMADLLLPEVDTYKQPNLL